MVLESIIKIALPECLVTRSDEFGAAEMISDKIIEAITTYEIAIADLTFHNPNVFYELGLRHMSEKPVIHICSEGTKLPFDNAGVSTIFFNVADVHSHKNARTKIAEAYKLVSANGYKISNPVTQARGSIALAGSADSRDILLSALVKKVEDLDSRLTKETSRRLTESMNYLEMLALPRSKPPMTNALLEMAVGEVNLGLLSPSPAFSPTPNPHSGKK